MDIKDLITLSEIFLNASEEDGDLVRIVEQKGYKTVDAERYVAFMPIAFGRVVINRIGKVSFSSLYKIKENSRVYSLEKEPIFCMATDLAIKCYEQGIVDKEVFSAIATRSAELNAVDKALNAGDDINGAEFAPIFLFGYKTLGKKKRWFSHLYS